METAAAATTIMDAATIADVATTADAAIIAAAAKIHNMRCGFRLRRIIFKIVKRTV